MPDGWRQRVYRWPLYRAARRCALRYTTTGERNNIPPEQGSRWLGLVLVPLLFVFGISPIVPLGSCGICVFGTWNRTLTCVAGRLLQ